MRRTLYLAILLLMCGPAHAAEGRIPIFEPVILDSTGGAQISGRYVVTRDITNTEPGRPAIRIIGTGEEQLDIDLNGFTVSSTPSQTRVIYATNLRTLVVRNGTLIPPETPSDGLKVEWTGSSADPFERVLIDHLTVIGATDGIDVVSVKNFRIRNCVVLESTFDAITIRGDDSQGIIENNVIRESGDHGVILNDGILSAVIRGNQIELTSRNGIHVAPGSGGLVIVADNAVRYAGYRGIFVNETSSCDPNTSFGTNLGPGPPAC